MEIDGYFLMGLRLPKPPLTGILKRFKKLHTLIIIRPVILLTAIRIRFLNEDGLY
jgi:hypothetical protein